MQMLDDRQEKALLCEVGETGLRDVSQPAGGSCVGVVC